MATVFDFDASSESDADLLARLRDGDVDAYEVLWSRHIGAAMRQGRKLSPDHAEDLVSESFLAVLRQVTTTDAGPRTSFRAYLFTVMRNTAMRWGRAALRSVPDPEVDDVDDADPSLLHEEDSDATEILRAFRTLPARWQRVLWLTEVEQVPRPEIASELGIRPNAVSSLHRRARNGLREEWLSHQVPADLRDAPGHVGRDLPAYVAGAPDVDADRIRSHVGGCSRCADALAVLSTRNSRRADLGIGVLGFGALAVAASQSGASVPVAAATTGTAGAGAASAGTGAAGASAAGTALGTAAGIGGSATSIAAIGSVAVLSIGAIAVSAIAATSNSTDPAGGTGARDFVEIVEPTVVSGPDAGGTPRTPPAVASAGPRATGVGAAPTDPGVVVAPGTDPGTEEVELAATGVSGRFAADPSVAAPYAGAPDVSAPASPAPTPTAPGTVPPPRTDPVERPSEEPTTGPVEEPSTGPVEEPTVEPDAESPEPPEPGSEEPTGEPTEEPTEDPTEEPTIPVAPDPITLELTTTSSTGFFAPVLTGTTQPGNLVAVEYAGEQYTVAPGADGSWSFDMGGFRPGTGPHDYRAWAYSDDEQSAAVAGRFTVVPLDVSGIRGLELLTIDPASSSASVAVELRGPAGGEVCLTSGSGASAVVTLDSTGHAAGRVTFTSAGLYTVSGTPCREDAAGGLLHGESRTSWVIVADPSGRSDGSLWPGPSHVLFEFPAP